ncbi:MAG: tetratricopeptide repeat protein [Synechococcaceae cyanobacterium]
MNRDAEQGASMDARHALLAQAGQHLRNGQLKKAESLYRQIIEEGHTTSSALSNLAIICKRTKRIDEAISLLTQAIGDYPELPELRYNLGNSLLAKEEWAAAIQAFTGAVKIRPDFPAALYNLGNAYRKNGELEAAIACYNKALCLDPDLPEALLALGISLREQNLMRAAIRALEKGLRLTPKHPEGLYNLGMAYLAEGDLKLSAQAYTQCLQILPSSLQAIYQLDKIYRQLDDRDAVVTNLGKAFLLEPQTAQECCELGIFLAEAGEIQRARTLFEAAIAINPEHVDANLSHAMIMLLLEEFADGWDHYDWRLQKKQSSPYYPCISHWIAGNYIDSLFIAGEQGVGDQIMFCSMLRDVMKDTGEITVQVDRRLIALMKRSLPQATFVDPSYTMPEDRYTACIPMGSLGRHYRRSHSAFRRDEAYYLLADKVKSLALHTDLETGTRNVVIGISWASRRKDVDLEKSVPLKELVLSLARPGVSLVSLQYGDTHREIARVEQETGIKINTVESINNFDDLDGLAALIDCCDLIVSASNVTVHLAGGLGKPTWMLLKKIPDWRWGLHRERTLWYPSVKAFRQCHRGRWNEPLQGIKNSLDNFMYTDQR